MKKRYGLKPILASLLVTVALAAPAAVLSSNAVPQRDGELLFEGASLSYVQVDGETTVQAIFNVSVDKVVNGTGAYFWLDYNPDYLTPSDINTNVPIDTASASSINTDAFFQADGALFKDSAGNSVSPFTTIAKDGGFYSSVDTSADKHQIHLSLELDQDKDGVIATTIAAGDNTSDRVELLEYPTQDEEPGYVLNLWTPLSLPDCDAGEEWDPKPTDDPNYNAKVTLGQISFQVNMERLPEIVKYFGDMTDAPGGKGAAFRVHGDPLATSKPPVVNVTDVNGNKVGETYLLDISKEVPTDQDPWQISAYGGAMTTAHPHPHLYNMFMVYYGPGQRSRSHNVKEIYDFNLPKDVIIRVEATNPELTINAYQNYTDGTAGDLPISLGKYSPMVTVTYADGSRENVPFPWGKAADGYTVTSGLADPYDPTHGDYTFSQYYVYEVDGTDGNGDPVKVPVRFPTPVTAIMHVTPITVLDVTADDLERTYALGRVTSQVADVEDLGLPTQARIITDIVPSGVSLVTRIKGWKPFRDDVTGSAWPTPPTSLHMLKGDAATTADPKPYWPEGSDVNPVPADHIGTYTFETSQADHATPEGILRADIKAAYPWLTVPKEEYPLQNAKRHIVANDDFADAEQYVVTYTDTVTASGGVNGNGDGQPTLTLSVRRGDSLGNIDANSVFRIWLPNGLEIGTGQVRGGVTVDDWFGGPTFADHTHGFYDPSDYRANINNQYCFYLDMNPDDPTQNPHGTERETLRRYINLGGWYKVAICENPDDPTPAWTDPIPVYVPPRRNEYTQDKVYNFIAENAALFNWPGGITDTLYLPQGSYTPVGPMYTASGKGLPLYDLNGVVTDGTGADTAQVFDGGNPFRPLVDRYEESYGVSTIYDGQTGAQPGEIFTVKVNQDPWQRAADGATHALVGADPVYKYGPTPLYDGVQIMSFGYVYQLQGDPSHYQATLRTQLEPEPPQLTEKIKLVSASPTGITRVNQTDLDSNVTMVTYDATMEGYTVRMDYTLTIKNVGDVDIYGLDIDGLTDGYVNEPIGGRFEMLKPPASFLPAGGSTTFTLTYVYDLKGDENNAVVYWDTLYITSTSHPNGHKGGTNQDAPAVDGSYDYLLDFDARFTVSKDPLHKVTVIYKPQNGNMGTAGLIVGEQSDGTNTTMNYTTTTQTFPMGDKVYVVVNKKDEYSVESITMTDSGGNPITDNQGNPITAYPGTATLADGTEVYVFEMPGQDVTITVNFEESTYAKLRLSNLIEFSAPSADPGDPNDLKTSETSPAPKAAHTYEVWRKTFSDAENTAADDWATDQTENRDLYLMTKGTVRPYSADPDLNGRQFLPSENQYIVVIDSKFDLSQVEATLRKVEYHEDYRGLDATPGSAHAGGYNDDIQVNVQMEVYPYQVEDHWGQTGYGATPVYDQTQGYGPRPGLTATPTVHTSRQFADSETPVISPKPGESTYVRITLSAPDEKTGITVYRYYYLEIHRKTDEPQVELHYGNSPYGMIMNEKKFTTPAARDEAKTAFRRGYTFRGALPGVTPDAVTRGGLDAVTYWREAWVRNEGLFEPESSTNINDFRTPNDISPEVYSNAGNLDLNDYAYFAILGRDLREPGVIRAWDSSGRPVDISTITAQAEVTLLDATATAQVARFSGTDTATIDLGIAGRTLTFLGEHQTSPATPVTAAHWPASSTTTTTSPPAGGDPVTTTTYRLVENIRPGQYLIQYTFTDFDGVTKLNYYRPFVILRNVGDVNTDGVRDNGRLTVGSDEYAIEDRVTDPLGYEAGTWDDTGKQELVYPHANVFKFRVCDVNNDRNINNIDANLVDKNVRAATDLWLRFYDPVDYGLD